VIDNYVTSGNLIPVHVRGWNSDGNLELPITVDRYELQIAMVDWCITPVLSFADPKNLGSPECLESLKTAQIYFDAFYNVAEATLELNEAVPDACDEHVLSYIQCMVNALNQPLIIIPSNIRKALENKIAKTLSRLSPHPGFIYLVQAIAPQTYYKIGLSIDPVKRIETMGVKLPFPITPLHFISTNDTYRAEKQLHDRFASKRLSGEWFALSNMDVQEITNLYTIYVEGKR
jgi:hypothetical protein